MTSTYMHCMYSTHHKIKLTIFSSPLISLSKWPTRVFYKYIKKDENKKISNFWIDVLKQKWFLHCQTWVWELAFLSFIWLPNDNWTPNGQFQPCSFLYKFLLVLDMLQFVYLTHLVLEHWEVPNMGNLEIGLKF